MTQTDAYINAGYIVPRDVAEAASSRLLSKGKVCYALDQLKQRQVDATLKTAVAVQTNKIADKAEIAEVMSQLLRGDLRDFQDASGSPTVTKDTINALAAKELYHRTRLDRDGNPIVTKSLKLYDRIEAGRELSKLYGHYAPEKKLVAQRVEFIVTHAKMTRPQEET